MSDKNPFDVSIGPRWLSKLLQSILGLSPLIKAYDRRPTTAIEPDQVAPRFLDYTLDTLGVGLNVVNPEQLDNIPKEGPVIFVSNHPLGGIEGVAMTKALLKIRPDTKVLTNKLLTLIPEFDQVFIGVNVLAKNAAKENAKGIRQTCQHLGKGGALLIYPSGVVSAINVKNRRIEDPVWDNLVGRLLKKYKAHCVPFFVDAYNSRLFYGVGLIHPRLRTVLLARELGNKGGQQFNLHVGKIISPKDFQGLDNDQAVTHYARLACDILKPVKPTARTSHVTEHQTIIDPHTEEYQQKLLQDIDALQAYQVAEHGDFSCYCAPYAQLASVHKEIAWAREVTFRAAGEGTGKSFDSDRFDPYYLHLFIWDRVKHKIVGGYRIGRVDEIVVSRGVEALYSRSLYEFNEQYIHSLGNCLEVGRSFVVPAYQRHPRALDLLWRGIGTYIANNPQYHTLFGCVSISQDYSELARAFLSESMMHSFKAEQQYLSDIKPITPLKVKGKLWTTEVLSSLSNIGVINKLIGHWDDNKGIPVLLRHYLTLNGRFICFSVNTDFSDSLDGLILVDLRETPMKYLQRYLGKEGAAAFLEKWEATNVAA